MNEQPAPTKTELLEVLRSSGDTFRTRLGGVPAVEFERGRYENGWTGRQILAHVAAIEWTYPRLIEIGRSAKPEAAGDAAPAHSTPENLPTRTAQGGIDAYNQRQVEKRAAASVSELLDEFRRNRETTIAAVEAADEAVFATPIRSAGGVTGPLSGVFRAVAVSHILGHMNDILGQEEP